MQKSPELHYLPFGSSPGAVCASLLDRGVVVMEGFPMHDSTEELIEVASQLGALSNHGIGLDSHRDGIHVHLVQPLEQPRVDRYGNVVKSTSNDAMGCHTDDYFSKNPVELVLLLCCQPAKSGHSTLMTISKLLSKLDAPTIDAMRQPLFPSPFGYVPLLSDSDRRIRYSAYEIQKMVASGRPILGQGQTVLNGIDEILDDHADVIHLRAGDCLLMHNHRVLHGRTSIDNDEPRLLKRVRLDRMTVPENIQ